MSEELSKSRKKIHVTTTALLSILVDLWTGVEEVNFANIIYGSPLGMVSVPKGRPRWRCARDL